MKQQYILSEEDYDKIIKITEEMDADLGALINHMDEYENVKKYAQKLSISMGMLGRSLEI